MFFRRNEGFRYSFQQPIPCIFNIRKIDQMPYNSDLCHGQIIDISPNGLKLMTMINLMILDKKIEIEIQFSIEDQAFEIPARVVWQQKSIQKNYFNYGIQFINAQHISKKIIEALKIHTRKVASREKSK
ncbi:PilZ domain-containing protein [Calidifontibacillus erzurumensis]|uniref:PilZ domain-containing protein n=1 Tax=Calidifontibacillus erzurumensis TaxID=2741433 RepID=A0A8J8GCA7_9BACI|nr:PilZ domain-containing protein [Calidifontibacillus erzurumensis]NSL50894.1 PilZ domain-containing protein [Calidifontibacillus erzurumensis]